jgi:hypothetical protein
MNKVEEAEGAEPSVWLELANGGGVILRGANTRPTPQPRYSRQRQPKQLPEAQHSDS